MEGVSGVVSQGLELASDFLKPAAARSLDTELMVEVGKGGAYGLEIAPEARGGDAANAAFPAVDVVLAVGPVAHALGDLGTGEPAALPERPHRGADLAVELWVTSHWEADSTGRVASRQTLGPDDGESATGNLSPSCR